MGYFSNGTEGESYFERYCEKCVHRDGKDGKSGCYVWLAHLEHNYDECNNPNSILHLLIPRKDGVNQKCEMFIAGPALKAANLLPETYPPHLQEWAKKQGLL